MPVLKLIVSDKLLFVHPEVAALVPECVRDTPSMFM